VRRLTSLVVSGMVCAAVTAPAVSAAWAQSSGPIQPSLPWGAKQRPKPNPQDPSAQDGSQTVEQTGAIKPLQGEPEKPRGEPKR
jgi:hypothetical protein